MRFRLNDIIVVHSICYVFYKQNYFMDKFKAFVHCHKKRSITLINCKMTLIPQLNQPREREKEREREQISHLASKGGG